MKFSEYVMNESLDEGIKDKLKDTAIKAGRKLGIKKAKNAETSGEKADREAKEAEKARKYKESQERLRKMQAGGKKAADALAKYISGITKKYVGETATAKVTAVDVSGDDYEAGLWNVSFKCPNPGGKGKAKTEHYEAVKKLKNEIYRYCINGGYYIVNDWYHGSEMFYMVNPERAVKI